MKVVSNQKKIFGSIIAIFSILLFSGSYSSNAFAEPNSKNIDAIPLKDLTKLDVQEIRNADKVQRDSMQVSEQRNDNREIWTQKQQSEIKGTPDSSLKSSKLNEIQKEIVKPNNKMEDRKVLSDLESSIKSPLTSILPIPSFK